MSKRNGPKGPSGASYGGPTGFMGGTYTIGGVAETVDEVDTSTLPDKFEDEDFEVVSKEQWLQGFWFKRDNPGRIDVYAESADWPGQPRLVKAYVKRWSDSTWTQEGIFDEYAIGMEVTKK